jgi:hypothetical protein
MSRGDYRIDPDLDPDLMGLEGEQLREALDRMCTCGHPRHEHMGATGSTASFGGTACNLCWSCPTFAAVSPLVERIRSGQVAPWVGEGADGARRSAQVCADEIATLDHNSLRRIELQTQRQAWLDRADALDSEEHP